MEKKIPHYKLSEVKDLSQNGAVRSTLAALSGAAALGIDFNGIIGVVNGLTHQDFYKSMTTYLNNKIWQDVYKPGTNAGEVYLKLSVTDDLLIVSFKEL